MCDCLLYVDLSGIKPGENVSHQTSIMWFLSRLLIGILLIQTKIYTHFLSSVISVKHFRPLNYYYYCCFCCCRCGYCSCSCSCFVTCFLISPLLVFASYTNHQCTPHLYSYNPVTHKTY
jgi:hypothetical protein